MPAVWLLLLLLLGSAASAEPVQPRIIGGEPVLEGGYPFQVALVLTERSDDFYAQFCGGSLIAPRWVLTAAHCVDFFEEAVEFAPVHEFQLETMTGSQHLDNTGRRVRVTRMIKHPDYDPEGGRGLDNDIALLALETPLDLPILRLLEDPALEAPGTMATAIGWGDTDPDPQARDFPISLHEADVPLVSRDACREIYGLAVTDNMLCAGYQTGGFDSCQGDSGGPLMVIDEQGYVQAGIVSWGHGCGDAGYYGVYTRVSRYRGWIEQETAARSVGGGIGSLTAAPLASLALLWLARRRHRK